MNNSALLCVHDELMILVSLKQELRRTFGDRYFYESTESVTEAWEVIEDLCRKGMRLFAIVSDRLMSWGERC